MNLQWIGLIAALAAFLGIWLGHIAVRKIEFNAPDIRLPALTAGFSGLILGSLSLLSKNDYLSAFLGIFAVTLLWDGFEFWRQEKRIKIGHAPANPNNPRHARILAENQTATTLDLLHRDPVGRPVSAEEAIYLVADIQR